MENKITIPDPLATWKDKKTDIYGLSMAHSISKDWFNGGMIDDKTEFATRRDWVRNKRLVARGEQDAKKYKDHVSRQEGDLTYLNLDWSIINIPEKFCNIVANGIKDEYYTLDIRAVDRHAVLNKKSKVDMHRRNMRALPLMKQAKQELGIDLIPEGFIPEDEEELLLYSEIKDRPKIEIAEEIIIDYIKNTNKWNNIEDEKNKDLVESGICVGRVWTDEVNGVKVEYIDPEKFIHSYVKKNDFSDAYYYGYVDSITIHEIQQKSKFSDPEIRKIAEQYATRNSVFIDDWESCLIEDLLNIKIDILRFSFKTNKTSVFKKHKRKGKTTKIVKKSEDFDTEERSDYGKLTSVKGTWMEGTYIIGSQYVYEYKECENIVRDEQDKPLAPFTVRATAIYKNKLHSFLDNIEPIANQMQYAHLKIQHLVAELKPDLVELDLDSLAELTTTTKGGKKQETWETALNIMNVKGVVFTQRVDMGEMGMKDKPGARPMPVQQGTGLTSLLNVWAHYYNLIRDTTGVNPARDGSLPHDALLGVNEMAQLASNTATKHIVAASIDFNKTISETISSRVHNIFRSDKAPHLKKIYERAVGKQNIEALEVMKDMHLHDFGFTVEMIPTKQEMSDFKEDLGISLQDGSIDVEIKAEAQSIAKINMKLAHQYLFYMRKKRRKQMMEEESQKAQMKSENDIKSAQAAAESQVQAYGMKTKIDIDKEQNLAQIEVMKQQALNQINEPKDDKQFQQEVYLKQLEVANTFNEKDYLENRKDKRTKIQAGQQSRLLEQRNKDNPTPIDFENNAFENIFNQK